MGLLSAVKAKAGDKVALRWSPSFAAPAVASAVHEQALERLKAATGLFPVEFPTTRQLAASARERAADVNAAFADPDIRAVLPTIGGEDQITAVPHLDPTLIAQTLNRSWDTATIRTCSTGCGPTVWRRFYRDRHRSNWPGQCADPTQERSLRAASPRAALMTGERLEFAGPGRV